MKDFFISYTRADRSWAEWIAWQLEQSGYEVVLQAWDFRPGSNFIEQMHQATQESARTIAVLSPDYMKSLFTQPEWAAAFADDPRGLMGKLIPVRVQVCRPEGLLKGIVYVDLVGLTEDEARSALLDGVRRGRAKPSRQPGFPGVTAKSEPAFPGSGLRTPVLEQHGRETTAARHSPAKQTQSVPEGELIQRIRGLLPSRSTNVRSGLFLGVACNTVVPLLRPSDLEDSQLGTLLREGALSRANGLMDPSQGTGVSTKGGVLIVEQQKAFFLLTGVGTVGILQPSQDEQLNSSCPF